MSIFSSTHSGGLILPNTRFLISLCNIFFVITQFTDTIFLVMSALGPPVSKFAYSIDLSAMSIYQLLYAHCSLMLNQLYAERYRISGFVWFTLWLSGWMLLWGIAACSIVIAYKGGGFVARVSSNPAMSKLFNTFFIAVAIFVTITHIVTFVLTVAKQVALASQIQIVLSQPSGSATSETAPTSIAQRIHSAMELASIRLLVPLGISLIRMLQKVKSTTQSERSGSCFQVIDWESSTRKGSKSSEKTLTLEESSDDLSLFSFAPSLHSSQQNLQEKAEALKKLAYVSKGLYAIVGLWSSWIFLRLTREIQSGENREKSIKKSSLTPHGSSPSYRSNRPSIHTRPGSSPTHTFKQLSLFQFPGKSDLTPP
ncbi:uncharacterized protein MELLADRAFT_105467 [Melampsora larici-populina 98AG31]|uniref:Uncharacterized protein n=1 Tax=Melampsora larici-populina (strain 98AG31 / pathotype 3-4-7) TaxID=747676 RepID=F4RI80_MELLP|nr:uncharacterized protein MELLADRAFT_105467 [Melampsora larici-populina 98AG31]EGG07958.1 hypothetical protein MELLADRAFT_105467 [Melampsora larici-populina 98AG31]